MMVLDYIYKVDSNNDSNNDSNDNSNDNSNVI